jgi:uncharacterized protein DUF4150
MPASTKGSDYRGGAVVMFPDVCFTPPYGPSTPVPMPYPNTAYSQGNTAASKTTSVSKPALVKNSNFSMSSGDEAGSAMGKQTRGLLLRGQLQMLHMQIASLPSGDPVRWHKLLDQYVILTAELYKTLSE